MCFACGINGKRYWRFAEASGCRVFLTRASGRIRGGQTALRVKTYSLGIEEEDRREDALKFKIKLKLKTVHESGSGPEARPGDSCQRSCHPC